MTIPNQQNVRAITSGPTLPQLLAALGDGTPVLFLILGLPHWITVNGMLLESGGRKIWFINGYDTQNKALRLYYNTDQKTGRVMEE